MSFLYPLGLLGLIGVPIVIIIYIIKNKYTEQVIASTYIWTLSEKFLKKRLPINRFVGLISLILQILAVIFISMAVAHPSLILPNAANDYLFIIDGSGSMNFVQGESTRLDIAKNEIASEIKRSADGSVYSIIFVGDTLQTYTEIDNKESALSVLGDIDSSCVAAGFTDALTRAQRFFNENNSVLTYLYTDKNFEEEKNVTVVNVAQAVENYALSEVSADYVKEENEKEEKLVVSGFVTSYESNAELTVNIYIDGAENASQTLKVSTAKLEKAEFTADCGKTDFRMLKVEIAEADALGMDNSIIIYNEQYVNTYNVLVVSEQPMFIASILRSVGIGEADMKIVKPEKYEGGDEYDLCIFDSYTPESLPLKAAVWFFNPASSVAKSGFTVQDEVKLQIGEPAKYSKSTATDVRKLLEPFGTGSDEAAAYIKKYQKCGFYRKFLTLMSCGDAPLIFTGTNEYGNREIVFAFDLHDTAYALSLDFIMLTSNLLNFVFPKVIEHTDFVCGDTLQINILTNCESVRVTYPSGEVSPPLYTSDAVYEMQLTEVGTYTVTAALKDGTSKSFNLYAFFPEEESAPESEGQTFVLNGEAGGEKRNGTYDNLLILFILLAVIFAADWGVYCYEQYQLR